MPQPRQQPRTRGSARQAAPPPEPQGTGGAGAAAAAAAAAALTAAPVAASVVVPAAGVTAATQTLLGAMDKLFRQRRSQVVDYVRGVVVAERPGVPASRVDELAAEELRREVEFQRKARQRLERDLPIALREADAAKRKVRVQAILDREKHYLGQRESAAASRAVAALEHDLLKQISPLGAYWKLSPLVKEHTLDCIAMGGQFWPWAVLDKYHPQLHPGCQCRLLSLDEAISEGLMTSDHLPDAGDAMKRAAGLMDEAHRLMETMAPEELGELCDDLESLRLQEAGKRQVTRWVAGSVKGGQFRPQRGGDRGALTKLERTAGQLGLPGLTPVERAAAGAGRDVTIRGQARRIPEAHHWEDRVGGARYTSPAGGTNLYRDGVLIGGDHPDLATLGGAQYDATVTGDPSGAPSKLDQPGARVTNAPEAPGDAWSAPEPDRTPVLGIPDYTGLALSRTAVGVQTAGHIRAADEHGTPWGINTYGGSQDRVASALLANAIYRQLGVAVPEAGTHTVPGEPNFASVPDVAIPEPPLPKLKPHQALSTGVILREPDGSFWVYEPKGHFAGYENTFPQGRLEPGLTPQQNALKELWEETGLHGRIESYVGDYGESGDLKSAFVSRFYLASRTGGTPFADDPSPYKSGGHEVASVRKLSPDEVATALNHKRDQGILADVLAMPVPEGGHADNFPAPGADVIAAASPSVGGKTGLRGEPVALGQGYMADAYLGNWDFVGHDGGNLTWEPDPSDPSAERPVRLDHGGALQYRAKGEPKPFGPIPTEVWTLKSPKGQGFGKVVVTESQMREQASRIGQTMTDARVDELVSAAPFSDNVMREEVRQALKDRAQWMRDFADGQQQLPQPLDGPAARRELALNQQKLEVYPEEHAALDAMATDGFKAVNDHLRAGAKKGESGKQVDSWIKSADELMRHVKLADDVYGYVAMDPAQFPPPSEMAGRTIKDAGYVTAVTRRSQVSGAPGMIRLTMPAGTRALYLQGVEGLEDAPPSAEVMLARGARMQIVGADTEDGRVIYDAVVIP